MTMIARHREVYVSDRLPAHDGNLARELRAIVGKWLRVIRGTSDIWCRDYMPVQAADGRLVQFRYRPDYLGGYPRLRTEDAFRIVQNLRVTRSPLLVDGGNVLVGQAVAIVTDKVYRENERVAPPILRQTLRRLLAVERLVVIPVEPGDKLGHADGVVHLVDDYTVLAQDYRKICPAYHRKLMDRLKRFDFRVILMPYAPSDKVSSDGIASAVGCYVNLLRFGANIIYPVYGLREDAQAKAILEQAFPNHRLVPINCRKLATTGGSIHCVTWDNVGTAWRRDRLVGAFKVS